MWVDKRTRVRGRHGDVRPVGEKYLQKRTMGYFEERLPEAQFVRVHRSHIVRLDAIKQIEPLGKETYLAKLLNKTEVPVSKSGYQKLKSFL